MRRRQCQRYTKRLETIFSSGNLSFRGISSDLSAGGLFIRTQHGFVPGTVVDIEVYLPDNKTSRLKGIVRRSIKTTMPGIKNGMGIELIERDTNYLDFLKTIVNERSEDKGVNEERESIKSSETFKDSGEGESVQQAHDAKERQTVEENQNPQTIIVICANCNVKNRVPVSRQFGLKCGKCGAPLRL